MEVAGEPFAAEGQFQEGCAEGAAEVVAAFAPIEAGERQAAAGLARGFDVDAQVLQGSGSFRGEVVGGGQPSFRQEAVVEGDAEGTGDVVVAGAGGAEMRGCVGNEWAALSTGEDREIFKDAGDGGAGEGEVSVAALEGDLDEAFVLEAAEVDAGGGGGDAGNGGELGGGAGVAIEEGEEHAGAGGLADGGGDIGGGEVDLRLDIHTLMVSEV